MTPLTHPNYSGIGRKLSYESVSLHTQDFLEMQELLRDSGDVLGTSNTQTPGVNKKRVQRSRVARRCGIGGRYDQPSHHCYFQ